MGNGWLPGDPNGGPYTGTALATGGNMGGITMSVGQQLGLRALVRQRRYPDHRLGPATNLGPNLEIQGVSLTSGSPTATITGTFPSTVAATDAITGPDIPGGTTVLSVSGGTLTLSQNASSIGHRHGAHHHVEPRSPWAQGAPIGIPVRILGVNGNSGTEATWASYANSGVGATGNCSGT